MLNTEYIEYQVGQNAWYHFQSPEDLWYNTLYRHESDETNLIKTVACVVTFTFILIQSVGGLMGEICNHHITSPFSATTFFNDRFLKISDTDCQPVVATEPVRLISHVTESHFQIP